MEQLVCRPRVDGLADRWRIDHMVDTAQRRAQRGLVIEHRGLRNVDVGLRTHDPGEFVAQLGVGQHQPPAGTGKLGVRLCRSKGLSRPRHLVAPGVECTVQIFRWCCSSGR